MSDSEFQQSRPLSGRTIIVTGGAQGIGAAIAGSLAMKGAHVRVCDLQSPEKTVNVDYRGWRPGFRRHL